MDQHLSRLADAVLQPGFVGTAPPDWLRRRLAEGLGSVVLYARNIDNPEQVAALTAALRAESPDVLVCVDEEAGNTKGDGPSAPRACLACRAALHRLAPRRCSPPWTPGYPPRGGNAAKRKDRRDGHDSNLASP